MKLIPHVGDRVEVDVTGRDLDYEDATVIGRNEDGLIVSVESSGDTVAAVTRFRYRGADVVLA